MLIENPQEHIACPYYDNVEFPLIKIHKFAPIDSISTTMRNNLLIFIMEGSVHYCMGNQRNQEAKKGAFLLIPQGWTIEMNIGTDCIIMAFRILHRISFCEQFKIEQLVDIPRKKTKGALSKNANSEPSKNPTFLKINTPIWNYLFSLYSSMADGLLCRNYFDTKIIELFYLLRAYYSKEQLYELFNPVASADTLFSDYVRLNHHKYKTVSQLADSMKMSYTRFSRKFRKIYHQPPYQWMINQRAEAIYTELTRGDKNLKQIAADFGFPSPAQFNDFCKNKWSRTPGEIRKSHK